MRNLWDIHGLLERVEQRGLKTRAERHGLASEVARAQRIAAHLFGGAPQRLGAADRIFVRRLLARDGWGRDTRPVTRLGFYVRSHMMRMPPAMLARHLWTKARR